jgi:hypothetical protein
MHNLANAMGALGDQMEQKAMFEQVLKFEIYHCGGFHVVDER